MREARLQKLVLGLGFTTDGEVKGPVAKFFSESELEGLVERVSGGWRLTKATERRLGAALRDVEAA